MFHEVSVPSMMKNIKTASCDLSSLSPARWQTAGTLFSVVCKSIVSTLTEFTNCYRLSLGWNLVTFPKLTQNTRQWMYVNILYCCTDDADFGTLTVFWEKFDSRLFRFSDPPVWLKLRNIVILGKVDTVKTFSYKLTNMMYTLVFVYLWWDRIRSHMRPDSWLNPLWVTWRHTCPEVDSGFLTSSIITAVRSVWWPDALFSGLTKL